MESKRFIQVCDKALADFREIVPNPKTRGIDWYKNVYGHWQRGSTGNMAFNATRRRMPDENTYVIYVDKAIAPYVPYTNEEWISPKWKGHKNPNQGWFERAAGIVAQSIARSTRGAIRVKKGAKIK